MRGAVARWVSRSAARAGARVFVIDGVGAPGVPDDLRLRDDVTLVDSPRSANILLVAGALPAALHEPARRVHDQMSRPRRVITWLADSDASQATNPFPDAVRMDAEDDLAAVLRRVHAELLGDMARADTDRRVDGALLPDVDPAPWRGVGPYRQGGTGMTGGVPYGRPMTGRASDRDGLELDQLTMRVGPFFPPFPSGMVFDVKLQGDVIQEATASRAVVDASLDELAAARKRSPFRAALLREVLVKELECARAVHHLRWLAHALRVLGLGALGRRALLLAIVLERDSGAAASVAMEFGVLARLLERARSFSWSTGGVGVLPAKRVAGRGLGWVARASGVAEDARLDDAAYSQLGFEPIAQRGENAGDARARWRQRLAEAEHSLALMQRAGAARSGGAGSVEGPRGVLSVGNSAGAAERGEHAAPTALDSEAELLSLLPDLLRGAEWGDAVTTIVSLDLAPLAAYGSPRPPSPPSSDG